MFYTTYYRTCPDCGAHLDPGEVCDCKREAAPGATNTESGKDQTNIQGRVTPFYPSLQ